MSDERTYLKAYTVHDFEIPLTSVDVVIFTIIDGKLNVLLVSRNEHPSMGLLALPGGFIDLSKDQDIDATAFRKLKEKTGVTSPYLEQVATIGNKSRDIRGWSVTVLYFALVNKDNVNQNNQEMENLWMPVEQLENTQLAFDHAQLIIKAHQRLQEKTRYTALPIELLPEYFTLTELQTIFEIILEKTLPIKSFRRRIISAAVLEPTQKSKLSGKRQAQLFKSNGLDRQYCFPRTLLP